MSPLPREFWIWAGWRDTGGRPPRPAAVDRWITLHNPGRGVPRSWWARYLIHKGAGPKPKPPPASDPFAVYRRVVFTAWEPLSALRFAPGLTVALSADQAYREAVVEAAPALRATRKFQAIVSWCDCDKTPAGAAVALSAQLGLDGWIGQAENTVELRNALAAGATVVVGNETSWRDDPDLRNLAASRIHDGRLALLQEDYWGEGNPSPDQVDTQGIPPLCFVLGRYGACRPLADYYTALPALRGAHGLYLAEGTPDSEAAAVR